MSAIGTLETLAAGEHAADVALSLGKSTLVGIRDSRNARIRVDAGLVWITQEGDVRDHLLVAGTTLQLERGGLALVHALRDSRVTVMAPLAHALSPLRRAFELDFPRVAAGSAA